MDQNVESKTANVVLWVLSPLPKYITIPPLFFVYFAKSQNILPRPSSRIVVKGPTVPESRPASKSPNLPLWPSKAVSGPVVQSILPQSSLGTEGWYSIVRSKWRNDRAWCIASAAATCPSWAPDRPNSRPGRRWSRPWRRPRWRWPERWNRWCHHQASKLVCLEACPRKHHKYEWKCCRLKSKCQTFWLTWWWSKTWLAIGKNPTDLKFKLLSGPGIYPEMFPSNDQRCVLPDSSCSWIQVSLSSGCMEKWQTAGSRPVATATSGCFQVLQKSHPVLQNKESYMTCKHV